MQNGEQEKLALEQQAAIIFAHCYQLENGVAASLIRQNTPPLPDATLVIKQQPQDIEIAHLYGSEEQAQLILGKALTEDTRQALRAQTNSASLDERLSAGLNKILASKAQKSYSSNNVWLVIRNMHPQWHAAAWLRQQPRQLMIQSPHPFEQIWLIADPSGQQGLLRLD